MTAYRPLTPYDYKILALASLGAMLEIYDFVIFIFLLNELGELFFPPHIPTWLVQLQGIGMFAAGFLVRPISGIIIGHFSDRISRKKMFTLTIMLMALPTLTIGLLPTYQTIGIAAPLLLLLMRITQGIAIGGEIPSAWVFVAEHTPNNRSGLGLGLLTCGISGGSLLAALVLLSLKLLCDEEHIQQFGWRIPFIIGGCFGLTAVYLRKFLSETPVFKELIHKKQLSQDWPLKTVLKSYLPASLFSVIMTWSTASVVIIVILLLPMQLQTQLNLPSNLIFTANAMATVTMVMGNISLGWLIDHYGLQKVYVFSWTGLLIAGYAFFNQLTSQITTHQLIFNYMLIGYFAGVTVTMPALSIRLFPAAIRVSGISFAYNIAFAATSLITPMVVTLWGYYDKLAAAHYLAIASMISITVVFMSNHYQLDDKKAPQR